MKYSHDLEGRLIEFECLSYKQFKTGLVLRGKTVKIEASFPILEYYYHGWQSWSLAAWVNSRNKLGLSFPESLMVLQSDIPYADLELPNSSWLGAVSSKDGQILFLGSLGLESHVELNGKALIGNNEIGEVEWFVSFGKEDEIFYEYASIIGDIYGSKHIKDSPRVWCSWYSLYEEINEEYLRKIVKDLTGYLFDVIQVDDGWQKKVGDWDANEKFKSGMESLAKTIKLSGKIAGLWLAPLLVVPSSRMFSEHYDWLLKEKDGTPVNAGFNWSEELFALDTTHPQVLQWLIDLMEKVREWGFDYIKLDFLYAGALPGSRYRKIPREAAFRLGLKTMREALGDAYLLTVGTPILPSIGLCDAIRIGPDVSGTWNPYLENKLLNNYAVPATQNAIRTSLNRLWLKSIIQTDPDVVYFQSHGNTLSDHQKQLLRSLALISNFKATSDLPHILSKEEQLLLASFLEMHPDIQKIQRYKYLFDGEVVDFSDSIELMPELNILELILQFIVQRLSNYKFALRIFTKINNSMRKYYIKRLFN